MVKREYENKPLFRALDISYCDTKHFNILSDEIKNITKQYREDTSLLNYEYEELTDLLYMTEMLSLYLRKTLNEKETDDLTLLEKKVNNPNETPNAYLVKTKDLIIENKNEISNKLSMRNYPVELKYDGEILTIHTPLTFKRSYRKFNFVANYLLATYLENAIYQWENKHKISIYRSIKAPYILLMKRTDLRFSVAKICDGDNLENQKIINTISRALGLPDNAQYVSMYSMFDEVDTKEECGMWFYLFSEQDMEKHLDLFKKRDKENVKDKFYVSIKDQL